jgi:hypothetical protein
MVNCGDIVRLGTASRGTPLRNIICQHEFPKNAFGPLSGRRTFSLLRQWQPLVRRSVRENLGRFRIVEPQHRVCPSSEIDPPFFSVIRYIQPRWKLVLDGICLDIGNGQSRVVIVKLPPHDEVSYYPTLSIFVVIKVHKAISD